MKGLSKIDIFLTLNHRLPDILTFLLKSVGKTYISHCLNWKLPGKCSKYVSLAESSQSLRSPYLQVFAKWGPLLHTCDLQIKQKLYCCFTFESEAPCFFGFKSKAPVIYALALNAQKYGSFRFARPEVWELWL